MCVFIILQKKTAAAIIEAEKIHLNDDVISAYDLNVHKTYKANLMY